MTEKIVSQLDNNGYFIGATVADKSPLEEGIYLLPFNAVDIAPPELKEGVIYQYDKGTNTWLEIEDYRGKTFYSTETGEKVEITQLGKIPENLTALVPLDYPCYWDGKKWVIDETKQAEIKAQQQAEMWERIKEKRYQNGLGGVYVESIGKWFQTGEEEKTKYLGLDRVIDKLGEIDWKTYDNTVVKMNRTLLDEIFIAMVQAENADHLNAEYHKQQMLLADDPLTYDYSTGWSKCYEENH
ncbi:uncharacterized protein DUF4376 [Volucribacter psittacicida]|uniref:Uncharacterized protein DUF4376 n=1 Tax=Volucribacter psittacicida TaxID=203482 RepID=A0A4R1FYH4_9PAST|nr:DUF4376 domain-containing protein [Volucribacter psittacicida]TCJ98839.1 uncharacterized protein DUF4376 [Volucribacter psittacicida]